MTPNEWWKEEPYYDKGQHCDDYYCHTDKGYNIEAIIEEVKRREKKRAKFGMTDVVICESCQHSVKEVDNYCRNCGAKLE